MTNFTTVGGRSYFFVFGGCIVITLLFYFGNLDQSGFIDLIKFLSGSLLLKGTVESSVSHIAKKKTGKDQDVPEVDQ